MNPSGSDVTFASVLSFQYKGVLICASKNSYILRMVTIGHPIYFNFNFSMARHNIYYFLFSIAFGH